MTGQPLMGDLHAGDRFELVETIDHTSIPQWVRPHLYQRQLVPLIYWALNLMAGVLVAFSWRGVGMPAIDAFSTMSMGIVAGFIVVLPIHEHIHAFAYRWSGASHVEVRYRIRTLSALCVAPGHVIDGRRFMVVCLAPLVVINTVLLGACIATPPGAASLILAGGLLMHTAAASGDVAFVQFVWAHQPGRLFTYDDPSEPRTYFFRAR